MRKGIIKFDRPDKIPDNLWKSVRPMTAKTFGIGENVKPVKIEAEKIGVAE